MITVRLFASLRERAGVQEIRVEMKGRATLSLLLDRLETRYPFIKESRSNILKSVNGSYAGEEVDLCDSDVVALMPPVSGG
jgi:MoaD family protein